MPSEILILQLSHSPIFLLSSFIVFQSFLDIRFVLCAINDRSTSGQEASQRQATERRKYPHLFERVSRISICARRRRKPWDSSSKPTASSLNSCFTKLERRIKRPEEMLIASSPAPTRFFAKSKLPRTLDSRFTRSLSLSSPNSWSTKAYE